MKLTKIFANKPFKAVRFNRGFNVILGEPKDRKDREKDTHNLGKSLLIDVIDFLMLKQTNKNHFLVKYKDKFEGYRLFLEIALNNGRYLVIRRGVDKPSKVSLKTNSSALRGFDENISWDHEDIPLDKAIELLNEILGFDVAVKWKYRKSISYFLRGQYDYKDVFQLSKYNKGKHREWKPFLFNLLGFECEAVLKKYELDEKKKELEITIEKDKERFAAGTKEMDKIRGIIEVKREEKREAEEKIDDFDFFTRSKEINRQLVDELDNRINTLNTIRYNITDEIEKIEDSLKTEIPRVDMESLQDLYKEVEIYFPRNLVKEYRELEDFNRRISEERQKYMRERFEELKQELQTVESELQKLERRKGQLLSILKDQDSYKKFKQFQKELAKADAEIARLEERLENMDKVRQLESQIKEIQEEINDQKERIRELIDTSNDIYKKIRKTFNQIIHSILNVPAIISISQNKEGNVEFHADIQNPEKMEVTAEASGTTYKKLLCMAFDLAVLIVYSDRSFYKFVYHDGALETLDDRKKINFLDKIREICRQYGLQYILTIIDSDLPLNEGNEIIRFPDEETVLRLHDRDDSGRLFEMTF